MMKKVSYFTEQGSASKECKDRVYFRENGESGFYSLADGVNSERKSHIGAGAIQKALADEWEKDPEVFWETPLEEVQDRFVEVIHGALYQLANQKKQQRAYASTLMVVFISRKLGRYRWLHIGDGIILKETYMGDREIISYEHNGITSRYTFSTISEPLSRFLRMGEGNMNLVGRFCMFTDGALLPFYKNREINEWGHKILDRGPERLYSILRNYRIKDDYSMLDLRV